MADQATLLQLLQFVGLITPALAILIELLVGFHGGLKSMATDKKVPSEVLILFFGFGMILIGGVVIGFQLIETIEGQSTQIAAALVFIGLPFIALSVFGVNLRIYGVATETRGFRGTALMISKLMVNTGIPAFILLAVFGVPPVYFTETINSTLNWWIFNNDLQPILYFYLMGALLSFKVIYSLWSHSLIASTNVTGIFEPSLKGTFVVGTFWLLIAGPLFLAYYGMLIFNVPFIDATSLLSAVPFTWGTFLTLILLSPDLDPIE